MGLEWLGVDVGWVFPAADSDGRIYGWSDRKAVYKAARMLATAGPVTITRSDGAVTVDDPYSAEQFATVLNRADHLNRCRVLAAAIVKACEKSHRGLALENWAGDRRHRNFLTLYQQLMQVAVLRSVPLALVDRAYTSQTCPACGHIDADNRADRNWFECMSCGEAGQADVIAARNISAAASKPSARYITRKQRLTAAQRRLVS